MPKVMSCVLLWMLEAIEGRLCSLEVVEVTRRVFCKLEAVEGEVCFLEVLDAPDVRGDELLATL